MDQHFLNTIFDEQWLAVFQGHGDLDELFGRCPIVYCRVLSVLHIFSSPLFCFFVPPTLRLPLIVQYAFDL